MTWVKNYIYNCINNINTLFKKNEHYSKAAWEYQKKIIMPHIKDTDVVIDIGSGNYPVPRADILVDFFPDESIHRSGNVIEDKPLVVCSIERLPFREKSIDFAISSHVFEHVDNPAKAASELMIIAKAGYIETPAYGKDVIVGSGYMHKWQIVEFEGTLHFFEYSQRQHEANICSPVMGLWMQKRYHPWQDFFWERQDIFNAWVLWYDNIKIIEYRRNNKQWYPLREWEQVPQELMLNQKPMLSQTEIKLLQSCLATPDHKNMMFYKEDHFEDSTGKYIYPIRGKRIYCEMLKSSNNK